MRMACGDVVHVYMCRRHRKAVWRSANGNKMSKRRKRKDEKPLILNVPVKDFTE